MKDLLVLLGKRVHELRVTKKWSQEEFADVAGLHRTYIGQVERGEKNISFGNLAKISMALGITPSELLLALDGSDLPHRNLNRKQESAPARVSDAGRRVNEIQKLLRRLRQQQNVVNETIASLEELSSGGGQARGVSSSSPRKRISART